MLPLLVERLRPLLDGMDTTYEVVAVDDGSTDLTAALLQRYHREWAAAARRPPARQRRPPGRDLRRARSALGATTSSRSTPTCRTRPRSSPRCSRPRGDGVDVVYGVRSDRSTDTWFKRASAQAFYTTDPAPSRGPRRTADAGDFRLMSRATVDAINGLPEHNRVLRFIVPALGFPSDTVEYRREERAAGASKYPLLKMIKLSLDSRDRLLDGAAAARDVRRPRRRRARRAPRALRDLAGAGAHRRRLDLDRRSSSRRSARCSWSASASSASTSAGCTPTCRADRPTSSPTTR